MELGDALAAAADVGVTTKVAGTVAGAAECAFAAFAVATASGLPAKVAGDGAAYRRAGR